MTKLETTYIIALCAACFIAGALTAVMAIWAALEPIA